MTSFDPNIPTRLHFIKMFQMSVEQSTQHIYRNISLVIVSLKNAILTDQQTTTLGWWVK